MCAFVMSKTSMRAADGLGDTGCTGSLARAWWFWPSSWLGMPRRRLLRLPVTWEVAHYTVALVERRAAARLSAAWHTRTAVDENPAELIIWPLFDRFSKLLCRLLAMFSLLHGGSWGGWVCHPWQRSSNRQRGEGVRRRAAAGDALSGSNGSYLDRVKGFQGPLKAGLTSGSLSAVGDLLAQFATGQSAQSQGKAAASYDPLRTLRMFGFGLCWYGPYQFYWYNMLDFFMPQKNTPNFLAKVALNQLALAPVVLAAVFAWNLGLTGHWDALPSKIANDLVPSMINGWKFWVPAASLNFYAVPLRHQVLYMSCCGMLWTAYLSYISTVSVKDQQQQHKKGAVLAAAAAASKGERRSK